ncbi:hypothetical protein SDC9_175196 [bioreactor metagenome]|uniref:Uncharacterized protein n=1 Tax=bioreactor metagenome TaxID=1076179 RepID=A0A645GPC8_9ZZZZ
MPGRRQVQVAPHLGQPPQRLGAQQVDVPVRVDRQGVLGRGEPDDDVRHGPQCLGEGTTQFLGPALGLDRRCHRSDATPRG